MIKVGTKIQIIDNSGGLIAKCIRTPKNKHARVGDEISVAIQTALPRHRVKKGSIQKAIIVQTRKQVKRPDGGILYDSTTKAIIINDKKAPIGTRATSPFYFEVPQLELQAPQPI